jgi:hypothetical protein
LRIEGHRSSVENEVAAERGERLDDFDWEFFVCHGRMASIEGELSNGHCSPLEISVLDNKFSFIEFNSNKYISTMSTEFNI